MQPNRRKQYLVDKPIQVSLTRRLMVYWAGTWLMVFALPICVRLFLSSVPFDQLASQLIVDLWFPMMVSVLLLPIVLWDSIRFSNRVAGPVFRIGRALRQLAATRSAEAIHLRKDDFCQDLADNANRVVETFSAKKSTFANDSEMDIETREMAVSGPTK